MKPKLIVFLVALALVAIILLQNTHVTTFRLLFWKLQMSQVVLVLIVLGIGLVIGFVVAKLMRARPRSDDGA